VANPNHTLESGQLLISTLESARGALPAKKGCVTPPLARACFNLPAGAQWEDDFEAMLCVVLLPAGEVFFGLKGILVKFGFGARLYLHRTILLDLPVLFVCVLHRALRLDALVGLEAVDGLCEVELGKHGVVE